MKIPAKKKVKKKDSPIEMKRYKMAQLKKAMLEALKKSLGILSNALNSVGISRTTYYRWLNQDEDFKRSVEEIAEIQLDFVEGKLLKLINDENPTAVIFYLKTKGGKKRGYQETQDLTTNGKDLTFVIIPPSED